MEKWRDGSLKVSPLIGWVSTNTKDGMSGLLRLEYATEVNLKERRAVQLVMTTLQVRELVGGLTKLAERLEGILAADTPKKSTN